jgi:hypothetical protein
MVELELVTDDYMGMLVIQHISSEISMLLT